MDNKFARKTIKEKLILAGIDEIGNCGVANFSLRQVAVACNVSCATPYNYFKNKEGFVVEIIQYIKHQWSLLKGEINKHYKNDEKKLLIELCDADGDFTDREAIKDLIEYVRNGEKQ